MFSVFSFPFRKLRGLFAINSIKGNKKEVFKKETFSIDSFWLIKEFMDYILINNQKFSFFQLSIGDKATNPFLSLITDYSKISLIMHIVKIDPTDVQKEFKKKLNGLIEEKISINSKGIVSGHFIDNDINEIKKRIGDFYEEKNAFYTKTIFCLQYEKEYKKLNLISSLFNIGIYPLYFRQLNAFRQFMLHTQKLDLNISNFVINNTSAINIFKVIEDKKKRGIYIGHEINTEIPLFEDFFSYENYNSVIMAKSGAGKSFLATQLIKRLIFDGVNVIVLDIEGEYIKLSEELHGVNIEQKDVLGIDKIMIDIIGVDYIKDFISVFFPSYDEIKKEIEPLEGIKEVEGVINKTNDYELMTLFSQKHTAIKDSYLMNFHIQSEDVKMYLYRIMKYAIHRNVGKTIIFIDESHKVLDEEAIAKYVRQLIKRGRKYNVGVCVISQDIVDFVQNKWSKSIISNATFKFLLKQEAINIPLINKIFNLSGFDEFLKNAQVGEGLFIRDNEVRKIAFDAIG